MGGRVGAHRCAMQAFVSSLSFAGDVWAHGRCARIGGARIGRESLSVTVLSLVQVSFSSNLYQIFKIRENSAFKSPGLIRVDFTSVTKFGPSELFFRPNWRAFLNDAITCVSNI